MAHKNTYTGFSVGFALGAIAGLVVALMIAPRTGRETRELAKDKAAQFPEAVKELTANREKVYARTWKDRRGKPIVSDAYFE
ncbi:MAG: hypothetical protein FJ008_08710 [Chloroflexi bacterium]|nr:hypothetical protein [Chloroflexota bacterium]MBM3155394.1 hypothetical protein [Chloroflexota bacterium]MBM3174026.1 hypothetical protein [Chloroflexota bacterium]MBM4452280.1 hypothetical protein [Chloroflexota bacterium]